MILLHRIGPRVNSNFNTLEEILACNEPLSFDGVYDSVLDNVDALVGKDVTLFVIGKYIGATNDFDVGQPPARFLTWPEIFYVQKKLNAKLGYHGWEHLPLDNLNPKQIRDEIRPPFTMDYYAYPGGVCNERVAHWVREFGYYKEAWSVVQGDDSQFQRKRRYLNW